MLVQSPTLAASVNASPKSGFHSLHYAPASSPRQSPSWVTAALSRRPSGAAAATPVASPSVPRAKRYVDAMTQYSPMEPFDYAANAARGSVAPAPAAERPAAPPSPPGPKPMALPDDRRPAAPVSAKPVKAMPDSLKQQRKDVRPAGAVQAFSPSKRKSIDEPGESSTVAANAARGPSSPSTLSKKPKPEAGPAKVVPQRYEHCPVEDMVVLISHMLGELIETNDALALRSGHLTRFHSR